MLFLVRFIGATIVLSSVVAIALAIQLQAWVYVAHGIIGLLMGGWVMLKPHRYVSDSCCDSEPPP